MNERTAADRAADDDTGADDKSTEERARRLGWVPKEEFRGDPAKWTSAEEFLARGERMLPIANERVRKLDDKLASVERQNRDVLAKLDAVTGELKESRETFAEFRERTANVEQRAFQRAREELKEEMRAAVKAADPAAFSAAEAKLEDLEKSAPKPVETKRPEPEKREPEKREPEKTAATATEVSDTVKTWLSENPWFHTDQKAAQKATALHGANIAAGMSEEESLADVRVSIEALRPDLFENQRREEPPLVQTPTNGGGRRQRTNERTFDDLPQEAKDAWARFNKQDPKFTKEAYLRDYAWE